MTLATSPTRERPVTQDDLRRKAAEVERWIENSDLEDSCLSIVIDIHRKHHTHTAFAGLGDERSRIAKRMLRAAIAELVREHNCGFFFDGLEPYLNMKAPE